MGLRNHVFEFFMIFFFKSLNLDVPRTPYLDKNKLKPGF